MFIAALFVNNKKLEAAQWSFCGWPVKQAEVHQHHGPLLRNKMEQTTDTCNDLVQTSRNYAERKQVNPKR